MAIFRALGFLITAILGLPFLILGGLMGLFFTGVKKVDQAVEGQLGEPYAKARERTVNGAYRVIVGLMVVGLVVFTVVTCTESAGRSHGDCDWTSHGEICGPG